MAVKSCLRFWFKGASVKSRTSQNAIHICKRKYIQKYADSNPRLLVKKFVENIVHAFNIQCLQYFYWLWPNWLKFPLFLTRYSNTHYFQFIKERKRGSLDLRVLTMVHHKNKLHTCSYESILLTMYQSLYNDWCNVHQKGKNLQRRPQTSFKVE